MFKRIEVAIPARVDTRIASVVCDLCHKEYPKASDGLTDGQVDWNNNCQGNVLKTCVSRSKGYSYAYGSGEVKTSSYHICPECFDLKLVPWLMAQGVSEPTESECDW